jgi:leader peptidase (prepilin peptidase)/N-methyltransferase
MISSGEMPGLDAVEAVWVALLGAVVGSFLNVVIYRLPRRSFLADKRSRCPACLEPIAWFDNLPVVSWLVLWGRCRSCAGRISARYPLVELLTAILFWLVFRRFGIAWHTPVYFALTGALVAITFIDIDHRIIPNAISLPGVLAGLLISLLLPKLPGTLLPARPAASIAGAAIGAFLPWATGTLWQKLRGVEAMGMGDVKMLAMIGAFLGAWSLPFVFFVAAILGSVGGILAAVLAGRGKPLSRSTIPFGPYLAAGAFLYLLVGPEVTGLWFTTLLHPARGG